MSKRKKKNEHEEVPNSTMPFRDTYHISRKTLKLWANTAGNAQARKVFTQLLQRRSG
jgi:hypothetical protein